MLKWALWTCVILFSMPTIGGSMPAMGFESTQPPHPINSLQIAARVLKKMRKNSHWKVIGGCVWFEPGVPPKLTPGDSISQFLPDLIVTVSNNPGENPWIEANALYENTKTLSLYQLMFEEKIDFPLGFGDGSGQLAPQHINEDRTRVVSVIGSPANVYKIKGITHRPETRHMKLYYSSLADAANERTQAGEITYMANHPLLLENHEIGSSYDLWGHEIPRLMRVTQPSRYRASVVAAMHAADIVTNNGMHIKQSTSNSCGPHCVVANVVFDPEQKQVIWQEVYPQNRNIIPGNPDDSGVIDEEKGNGNYVFVVWRKYKGCVTQKGKLLWGTPHVGSPQKR